MTAPRRDGGRAGEDLPSERCSGVSTPGVLAWGGLQPVSPAKKAGVSPEKEGLGGGRVVTVSEDTYHPFAIFQSLTWECLRVITTHNQQTSLWSHVGPFLNTDDPLSLGNRALGSLPALVTWDTC